VLARIPQETAKTKDITGRSAASGRVVRGAFAEGFLGAGRVTGTVSFGKDTKASSAWSSPTWTASRTNS